MSTALDRQARLDALQEYARTLILEQITAVEQVTAEALLAPVPASNEAREHARTCAHKVAGSAGSFGWNRATEVMREAEAVLKAPADLDIDAAIRLSEIVETARAEISGVTAPLISTRSPTNAAAPVAAGATVDIVAVEDDAALATLIQQVLRDAGWTVEHVNDGVSALGALGGSSPVYRPRLLLLDIDLPGRSGLSLLRAFQRDGVCDRAKVVMLSSRSGSDDQALARRLGAHAFMSKPFALDDLTALVRAQLA